MSDTRVIKRYANRKLYDTQRSRYITLEQIADLIRDGQDVKIVDNNSKEDLTSITLAQIILEQEKKQQAFLPLAAMKNIIRTSGASLSEFAVQAGAKVRSVFQREDGPDGELDADGAPMTGEGGGSEGTAEEAAAARKPAHVMREFLERSQSTFDEFQKRVDERVRHVVETLAPWTVLQKEIVDLSGRLADLEKKLDEHNGPGPR